MKKRIDIRYLTKASMIAGIYIILVLIQMPMGTIAFGPIQLRLAEGLVLLPLIEPAAIPGLFIGCLISNTMTISISGFGIIDILGGSLVTLLAAYLTSKAKNKYLGSLPPIILNAFIISSWVSYFTKIPYLVTVWGIGIGEAASVLILGNLFLSAYKKAKILIGNN